MYNVTIANTTEVIFIYCPPDKTKVITITDVAQLLQMLSESLIYVSKFDSGLFFF